MDDIILIKYLKEKGIDLNMPEQDIMDKLRESLSDNKSNYTTDMIRDNYPIHNRKYDSLHSSHSYSDKLESLLGNSKSYSRRNDTISESELSEIVKALKSKHSGNEHFNESYAKYLVSNMYHYVGDRKCIGDKYDMNKAKEVMERYRVILPNNVTCADVYVAINSQYHDYCELFKSWFGEDIDQKIIESAIIYWFNDCDYTDGFKLWNYFKDK